VLACTVAHSMYVAVACRIHHVIVVPTLMSQYTNSSASLISDFLPFFCLLTNVLVLVFRRVSYIFFYLGLLLTSHAFVSIIDSNYVFFFITTSLFCFYGMQSCSNNIFFHEDNFGLKQT
jgi:hypothetical protein